MDTSLKSFCQVLVLIVILTPLSVMAQNTSIGIRAGLNLANLNNENSDNEIKPGLLAGGFITYSIVNHFGVGAELNFVMRGASPENGNGDDLHLNYLEIPLLAKYFFGQPGEKLRPKLMLGPSFAFLLSANRDDTDVSNSYKGSDIGLLVGGGFNYSLGGGKWLNVDLRYTHGLTSILENDNVDLYNRNIAITAGISFPLGNY